MLALLVDRRRQAMQGLAKALVRRADFEAAAAEHLGLARAVLIDKG